jgi:TRAF3-interacting protein 1
MVENNNPYWKVTSDLFSKLIEKPKMSEKHLSRPPPKYIYDIIVNVMKVTNFPNGLYTDKELDPKFFDSDKEHRMDFLQKAVDITKIVLGVKLDVKVKNMRKSHKIISFNLISCRRRS